MALLEWSDKFSVGVGILDVQHKKLLGMLNELNDAMGLGKSRDVLGGLLDRLIQYTKMHFAAEEALMEKWGFAGLLSHRAEHELLTEQVMSFRTRFASGQTAISVQLLTFLRDWLVNHIQKSDKQYAPSVAHA